MPDTQDGGTSETAERPAASLTSLKDDGETARGGGADGGGGGDDEQTAHGGGADGGGGRDNEETARGGGADNGGEGDSDDDPYDLHERFVRTQREHFPSALAEIRGGGKYGCWSWFVWPTPPFVVDGVERGSGMNRAYALRDNGGADDGAAAARAFLRFPRTEGVDLRANYVAMAAAVAEQLDRPGASARALVGAVDEPKLRSSLELFERASRGGVDDEVHATCTLLPSG